MGYVQEFRSNWRALLASSIGHAAGLAVIAYVIGTFAPPLMQEFGWSKSDFALLGTVTLLTLVCLPVIGRLTDVFGVRPVVTIGACFMPLSYWALSEFNGELRVFMAIAVLQVILGTTTTSTVYSRLVAERFHQARGMALAIMASAPAMVGAIGAPLLSDYIDDAGWRAGYRAMALLSAGFGLLAILLIPKAPPVVRTARKARDLRRDYAIVLRTPAFWLIAGGIFLCNIPQALHGAQLKILLLDNGLDTGKAARAVSLYAAGVVIGRFACGLALDRFPAHIVAAISMGVPCLGMWLIASPLDAGWFLAAGVILMGLSQGAEGDLAGFLVMRYFDVGVYSSVLGLVIASLGVASSIGAVLLSLSLKATDSYAVFLTLTGAGVLCGGGLFLLLGGLASPIEPSPDET